MALPSRRTLNAAGFLACVGLMAYALFAQYQLKLDPCPLCVLQRIAVIGIGLGFLLLAAHNPQGWTRRIYLGLLSLFAIGGIVVCSAKRRGREMPQGLRRPEPSMTILGDWAIFSDSTKLLERFTQANRDAVPRLTNEPDYELIISELGAKLDGEEPFAVMFARAADSFRQIYELIKSPDSRRFLRMVSNDNPMIAQVIELLERNELPPFEEFEKYFAPSGGFAYDEPSGIHLGSFTLRADE